MIGIRRILVANRGEIAVRVVRTCRRLGIETVLAVSSADRGTRAAQLADRVICIGGPRPSQSYLNAAALITAACGTGCDGVHPGYGFLAENAEFARLCRDNGLTFIGPTPEAIDAMGNKVAAREIARQAGVPIVPGSDAVHDVSELLALGDEVGYPLLIKASAGGGGRGMRLVHGPDEAEDAFSGARAEARDFFGDPSLYVERFVDRARHVEVQLLGDGQGNVLDLGERDCTLQRRYQKVIEESPCPVIDAALRAELTRAARLLGAAISYRSAGTVEFILDPVRRSFFFLEMNTRIQVEHPVSEMVTRVDIVEQQIRVARGEPLSFASSISPLGHALECRINAEAPERGFLPSPGRITLFEAPPEDENLRIDTHCFTGYEVPPFYDSLLAKVIVWAPTRREALDRMRRALGEIRVEGVQTNIALLEAILANSAFQAAEIHTKWLEESFMPGYAGRQRLA